MSCVQDASFGPASTCRTLDFTLYFEQTILSLTPDAVFLVLALLRLRFLLRLPSAKQTHHKFAFTNRLASPGSPLLSVKALSLLLIFASSITSLAYGLYVQEDGVQIWKGGAVLQVLVTIPLAVLSLTEHFASPRPSVLTITYTLLKTLFTGTALRTYTLLGLFSTGGGSLSNDKFLVAPGLATSSAVLTAAYSLLFCAELVEKRKLLKQKLPVISTSSILTRSLYLWLLPLLWHGRTHTLSLDDCGEIPYSLGAQATRLQLEDALRTAKEDPRTRSAPLIMASLRAFHTSLLAPVLPRLILLLATFAQPLLVNRMIEFVSSSSSSPSHRTDGWALVGGFICVYALIAVCTSIYWEKVFDATVRYRGALVGVIYSKTLRLSSAAGRGLGDGVATTYMSVDVERICEGAEFFHEMWASLVSIGLSIALIYSQATWPAFLPLILTLLLLLLASLMGGRIGKRQSAWLAATDARVKFLSSVVARFLPIKWSAYERVLAERARELREKEMHEAKSFYYSMNYTSALSATAGTLCILAVLGPYAALASRGKVSPLDANRLFTIVTTVNLLSTPLNLLGQFTPFIAASYASLKRIQGFLLLEEKPEDQDIPGNSQSSSSLSTTITAVEIKQEKETAQVQDGVKQIRETESEVPAIDMLNASFSWTPDVLEPFLKDITLHFSEPQLYMCIGSVASGKSLLLMSILGEMTLISGTYEPPTSVRVAYAAQDALIIPGTVRENILFGRMYDAMRYNQVLDACELRLDVGRMPSGDGTLLAEKGSRLSGGQKQRIALARAVYADAAWTLLDDPLSALDAETEERVFDSLFGEHGLLKGKHVILVTHNIKHLSAANHIVVLDSGRITYQGNLDEIIAQGHHHSLLARCTKDETEVLEKQSNGSAAQLGEEHMDEQEPEEAAIAKSSRGFTPYLFFARMATWRNSSMVILVLILSSAMQLGLQFYLKEWSASGGSNLGKWAGGYSGFALALLLTNLFSLWLFATVVTMNSGKAIHAAEVQGLFSTAPSYFMSTPAGRIVNRFSQDIFLVDFEFPVNFLNGIIQFVTLIGTLAFIFIPVPWLALSIFPLGAMYYIALIFYLSTAKQLQHLEASSKSPLYTVFSTTLSGLETIRALKVERYFQDQNDIYLNRSQQPFYFRFGGMRFLRTLLALISFVIAVSLSALTIGLHGAINPSSLGLALSSLTNFSQLLNSFLMSLADIENGSVAISRIHEIVSLPPEEQSPVGKPAPNWPSTGNVTFEDVHMRYKADLDPALKGVSFEVKGGQKVGICGRSGSGKSSLILALFRGLDRSLKTGKITIDGLDIEDLSLETLRKATSLVAQDPFLWHSSLRDNLDPEQEFQEQDIWMALKRVGMSDAVSALPEKLDVVLEDGGSFSKGQRQLLCLCRVLLQKKKIVVLDEASSSLDLQTDEQMRQVVSTELSQCTVIAVAHRIATIIDFDWIIVMDNGAVVECGSPHDLLCQPDSKFARLANSQDIGLGRTADINDGTPK